MKRWRIAGILFLAMAVFFGGCQNQKPVDKTLDRDQISSVVVIRYASPPGPQKKEIKNSVSLQRIFDLWENAELVPLGRKTGDPGTLFSVSCEQADFLFSLQVDGLFYRGEYYQTPQGMAEELEDIFSSAPEEAVPV